MTLPIIKQMKCISSAFLPNLVDRKKISLSEGIPEKIIQNCGFLEILEMWEIEKVNKEKPEV